MKQIKTLLALLCIVLTAASCSQEIETEAPQTPTDVAQLFKIAPFPAFDEGAQTRTIGTADPGKTKWENGDKVLLYMQLKDNSGKIKDARKITLTYNDGAWRADESDLNLSNYTTADITAYYAPEYEWAASSEPKLISGKVKGTTEYITCKATSVNLAASITIDFAKPGRGYSRLRIATVPNMKIKVEMSQFVPVNETAASKAEFTLTPDDKGNAYLYGVWRGDITVSSTDTPSVELAKKTGLESGQASYALAAYPTAATSYDAYGSGDAGNPYQIWNAAQLLSMNKATAFNSKIFSDKHFKLLIDIDCSGITEFTPIGNNEEKFAGTFDGGGHTIRNLTLGTKVSTSDVIYSGLFAYAESATISNLTLLDPKLNEGAQQTAGLVGALIGYAYAPYASAATTITNCHVCLSSGSNARIESTSTSNTSVGGLIGQCSYTILQACSSAIPVISNEKNSGGLIGYGGNITLIGCRTTGAVTGGSTGGLAGMVTKNGISIVGCYSSGALSGKYAGGFVGNSYNATVLSSYCSSSNISGINPGSFLGYNVGTFNLYYSAATSNWGTKGIGLVGNPSTSDYLGEKLDCPLGELYGAIVNLDAEAKWQGSTFDKIRPTIGYKSLSDIWVNASGATPKLWWEK